MLKAEFILFLKRNNVYIDYRSDLFNESNWKGKSIYHFFDLVNPDNFMLNYHLISPSYSTYNEFKEKQLKWAYYNIIWLLYLIGNKYYGDDDVYKKLFYSIQENYHISYDNAIIILSQLQKVCSKNVKERKEYKNAIKKMKNIINKEDDYEIDE